MQETGSVETADTTIHSPANPRPHLVLAETRGFRGIAADEALKGMPRDAVQETISG